MLTFFQNYWAFLYSLAATFKEDQPLKRRDVRQVILRQLTYTGQQAFRLVALSALFIGMMTVAQSAAQLTRFGGSDAIGSILIAAIVRELGPLITVLIVVSRSVSAVASELSSMKANGEIDALKGTGVSPLSYLVVPRVLSGAFATMLLGMHFIWIALLVGFISSQFLVSLSWLRFIDKLVMSFEIWDLILFLIKTLGLGMIVFSLACFCGLRTRGNSFEVPQATTQAVVYGFLFALIFQILVSGIYYLSFWKGSLGAFL